MPGSDGEDAMTDSFMTNEEERDGNARDDAADPPDKAAVDQEGIDFDESDDEPSGESLQGDCAAVEDDDDDESDGSGSSINEFVVGDDEEDDDGVDVQDAAADGDDTAPNEVDSKALRKKMKRRRNRLDSELQEEAEELLQSGTTKHRVRVGAEAVDGGGDKSSSPPASDDVNNLAIVGGNEKKVKPDKGARSMDMKYKEEEDDENQRDYRAAFSADIVFPEEEGDALPVEQLPALRVVDPMDEFESYETAEDKAAIAADVPERIFDALPPGKMPLNGMADWQRNIAPQVVAFELKKIASDFIEGKKDLHLGFEHLIQDHADPKRVYDATLAVATHIGLHLREPPFIRRYLSSCYSSVLHHEALWFIFDRVMDATLLVKNAADCINLMAKFLDHDDLIYIDAQILLKDKPEYLSQTPVFDLRHHVHVMKYKEALAAGAVCSLRVSEPNFHLGAQKPEVHDFIASFTLPAHQIMECLAEEKSIPVPTPAGQYIDLLERLVAPLGKSTSELTERVVVATASKIIFANVNFRHYVRSILQNHISMIISVTPEGYNQPREFFCAGEHFSNQSIEQKMTASPEPERVGYKDLFNGDGRGCDTLPASDIWANAPTQPLGCFAGKSMSTLEIPPDHLAQWYRLEKQGWVRLEFKYEENLGTVRGGVGADVLRKLKDQVKSVYFDLNSDPDDEFNMVRGKILNEVFHKHLIPLIVREQKEAATARARQYMQIRLYRNYRAKIAFPPLQPPLESEIQDPTGDFFDDVQKENFRIPKIMTVCHSRVGCDPHFVISTVGAGSEFTVIDHFSHQKRRLGADAMRKFGDVSNNPVLRKDPELKHKLDQFFQRYGNIYSIVVGCHNLSTRDLFEFLDEYMKDEQHLSGKVYYFDEQVSRLIANGTPHAYGEAYLVAESLARFVVDPSAEAFKLFAARERPLIHRLQVHSEQGILTDARRREIAARVMVDYISTNERPVSFQIFCAPPAQARLLLQFVPGLGPRKANQLAGLLCYNRNGLETREDFKCLFNSVPIIGDVTFMNCAGFLSGSGQLSSDRDIEKVSDLMRECKNLERTYVHPSFYTIALEIAQLKTNKKGTIAISAFQRYPEPPTLSQQELQAVFESDVSAYMIQSFAFCTDHEAPELIKAICRMMHSPDHEFSAFVPMPKHRVFERLLGFKPQELLFMKTTACVTQNGVVLAPNSLRVHVQEPEMDGRLSARNFEKKRPGTLAQVLNGVDVIDCVILEVDLQRFSVEIGNRSWMMNMHQISKQPKLQSEFLPAPGKSILGRNLVDQKQQTAPADSLVRPRLCSLPWFKNMPLNAAKQAAKTLGENRYLACPDVARDRISVFVCFAPGICVQFHIVEMKWDSTRPDRIGTPLRIGCPPLFQDYDEMAEIEARFIIPLISRKNEVVSHPKFLKVTAAEAAKQLHARSLNQNMYPWALIFHEDKPGVFKFVWYARHKLYHHSFCCSYNGFFVDGVIVDELSTLILHIISIYSKRP